MITGSLIRVLIADDHNLVLTGIQNMLDKNRFLITGTAKNGKELFVQYLKLQIG